MVVVCLGDEFDQQLVNILLSENPIAAESGDTAQAERTTSLTVSIQEFVERCPDGFSYQRLAGDIKAFTVNFQNGVKWSAPFYFYHPYISE